MLAYRNEGDQGAFDQLVVRYERELYSYLRRFLSDQAAAEDAFQGTFLQVHLKCDQFEADRKFRPWLYTIATNQAIDLQRRSKRHKLVSLDRREREGAEEEVGTLANLIESREAAPQSSLESAERERWVRGAVAELPEQLRTAVNMIYYQGLKYREAADQLKVPVGTVKSRLHTAVQKLNDAFQERTCRKLTRDVRCARI
ncbi:MAG: sigma-70 family RNA polymerase sigma factor [Pirellulales bacterium]